MVTLTEAVKQIQLFQKDSLRNRISSLEDDFNGADKMGCESLSSTLGISPYLLKSVLTLKRASGQVNVMAHAIGILLSLPYLLYDGEVVEALSLGAGNTGRPFDLETNLRVAEFKFIHWKGGPESIRKNQLFKDFYLLAEFDTLKERYLYVVDTMHPLRFLNGDRAIKSIMSRNNRLWDGFQTRYGNRFSKVNEYYHYRKSLVNLVDLAQVVPFFAGGFDLDDEDEDN
jgi:hypothetical protein